MRPIVITLFILLGSSTAAFAQEWNGIRLLESTCDDVKRGLGVDKCDYPESIYQFPKETVVVGFVLCPCPISCYHYSGGWNVPKGTVAGITRKFLTPVSVADFDVKNGKWTSFETDMIGEVWYSNTEEAISLRTLNGRLLEATYLPQLARHRNKQCPTCIATPPPPNAGKSVWLSGYNGRDADTEQKRLDEFAEQLRKEGNDFRAYIVAYDGCLKKGEATVIAERAKRYLVSTKGIDRDQVIIIDAGQRSGLEIELHVRARGLPPPYILSSVYPKVQE